MGAEELAGGQARRFLISSQTPGRWGRGGRRRTVDSLPRLESKQIRIRSGVVRMLAGPAVEYGERPFKQNSPDQVGIAFRATSIGKPSIDALLSGLTPVANQIVIGRVFVNELLRIGFAFRAMPE
jgi:hypothetical protein